MGIWSHFIRAGNVDARRFVFNEFGIASLKKKAMSSGVENPTRVEVVTAILCKSIIAAFNFNSKSGDTNYKPLAINHAVNVQRRMLPPFPECSMGNFVCFVDAIFRFSQTQLGALVCQVKEAIAKIDGDFVKEIQGDGGFIKFYEMIKEMKGAFTSPNGVECVLLSSWCNFGLYEADFGWGIPVWTSFCGSYGNFESPFNHVVLMDT